METTRRRALSGERGTADLHEQDRRPPRRGSRIAVAAVQGNVAVTWISCSSSISARRWQSAGITPPRAYSCATATRTVPTAGNARRGILTPGPTECFCLRRATSGWFRRILAFAAGRSSGCGSRGRRRLPNCGSAGTQRKGVFSDVEDGVGVRGPRGTLASARQASPDGLGRRRGVDPGARRRRVPSAAAP